MHNELLFLAESGVVSLFALLFLNFGSAGLFSFISIAWVTGNIFVFKEVILFGLPVVTTDVFAIGCDVGISLLREYYGEKEAQRSIVLGMISLLFFVVVSLILLFYIPSPHDTAHFFYDGIFSKIPRVMLSSIIVAAMSKSLNLFLLDRFGRMWPKLSFKIKTFLSISISQLFDTILYTYLALYGTVESPLNIIIFGYIVKLSSIAICVPLITTIYSYLTKYKKT